MAYTFAAHKDRIAMRSDLTLFLTHLTRPQPAIAADDFFNTPAQPGRSSIDILMEILTTHTIRGSGNDGFVCGQRRAVCFQNTPLYSLGQMFYQERELRKREAENAKAFSRAVSQVRDSNLIKPEGNKVVDAMLRQSEPSAEPIYRYTLYGLSFDIRYIWRKGGRPVIYEKSDYARANLLEEDQHWRVVDLDLDADQNITDWTHEREWRVPTDVFDFDLGQAYVLVPDTTAYRQFLSDQRQKANNLALRIAGIIVMTPVFY